MTNLNPYADRPQMPEGYQVPTTPPDTDKLSWAAAEQRLTEARNYWVCTTRPDGRPHAMPLWGLWLEGALYFDTSPASVTGQAIAANPYVVAHLEDGSACVILEGKVEDVSELPIANRVMDLYEAKYGSRPFGALMLRPKKAFTWGSDFAPSATRWTF